MCSITQTYARHRHGDRRGAAGGSAALGAAAAARCANVGAQVTGKDKVCGDAPTGPAVAGRIDWLESTSPVLLDPAGSRSTVSDPHAMGGRRRGVAAVSGRTDGCRAAPDQRRGIEGDAQAKYLHEMTGIGVIHPARDGGTNHGAGTRVGPCARTGRDPRRRERRGHVLLRRGVRGEPLWAALIRGDVWAICRLMRQCSAPAAVDDRRRWAFPDGGWVLRTWGSAVGPRRRKAPAAAVGSIPWIGALVLIEGVIGGAGTPWSGRGCTGDQARGLTSRGDAGAHLVDPTTGRGDQWCPQRWPGGNAVAAFLEELRRDVSRTGTGAI